MIDSYKIRNSDIFFTQEFNKSYLLNFLPFKMIMFKCNVFVFQIQCQQRIPLLIMNRIFKSLTTVCSQQCWFYQLPQAHISVTSSKKTKIIYINNNVATYTNEYKLCLIRRRTEKNVEKRQPIQREVSKKPVSDFGSKSLNEYLLGSRNMKPFPVAMSLVAR